MIESFCKWNILGLGDDFVHYFMHWLLFSGLYLNTKKAFLQLQCNWQVIDWSDRCGCSLWKLLYALLACVRLCGTDLVHMFLFPIHSWRIWSVISHLQCSWFSINLTLIKLSLAISLWTSAAFARLRAVDGHPPRISPCRAITSLSHSF